MTRRIGTVGARAARNVKALRAAKGISQSVIGEVLGLDDSVVSRIERGARPMLVDEAAQIANVLGVTCQELLFADLASKAIRERAARLRAEADELEAGL